MKLSTLLLPVVAALALSIAPQAFAQHEHGEHDAHADHAAPESVAIPAQRYATDAPLREGMSRIHAALEELRHYEMGHMPQSIAVEKVASIKDAIDYVFANCKLDAKADAALHSMLVPLLNGVQAFNKDPADTSTVASMRDAIADYPRVFADPSWELKAGSDEEHSH
ncbi:MAG TPA: DnrO protein [Dokdonella sp.]|uniref:DnrO protein n=1 Tax=Dokdonella sp. TaxID=2291710 RepID=UPI002D805670|nr:DnrO protein [Dokdonella sp.]HET9033332.1 DnrO protein [Dokdonella sp.]